MWYIIVDIVHNVPDIGIWIEVVIIFYLTLSVHMVDVARLPWFGQASLQVIEVITLIVVCISRPHGHMRDQFPCCKGLYYVMIAVGMLCMDAAELLILLLIGHCSLVSPDPLDIRMPLIPHSCVCCPNIGGKILIIRVCYLGRDLESRV